MVKSLQVEGGFYETTISPGKKFDFNLTIFNYDKSKNLINYHKDQGSKCVKLGTCEKL
jgi:hypothetical protein